LTAQGKGGLLNFCEEQVSELLRFVGGAPVGNRAEARSRYRPKRVSSPDMT
jgi:hypothetical protein